MSCVRHISWLVSFIIFYNLSLASKSNWEKNKENILMVQTQVMICPKTTRKRSKLNEKMSGWTKPKGERTTTRPHLHVSHPTSPSVVCRPSLADAERMHDSLLECTLTPLLCTLDHTLPQGLCMMSWSYFSVYVSLLPESVVWWLKLAPLPQCFVALTANTSKGHERGQLGSHTCFSHS